MKILIGTPAYGGMISANYLVSMISTVRGFIRDNIDFKVHTLSNESLINRGRNTIANVAIEGGYDKLIFIDADIGWKYDDICALCNSTRPIIGGTYPLKALPIALNFNPLPSHFQIFKAEGAAGVSFKKTLDKMKLYREKYADARGEVEVLHVPTGFLCIDLKALHLLKEKVPTYSQPDSNTGNVAKIHEFFPVRIKDDVLESEDWAFCSIARENGIPIYLNTNISLTHMGAYIFSG